MKGPKTYIWNGSFGSVSMLEWDVVKRGLHHRSLIYLSMIAQIMDQGQISPNHEVGMRLSHNQQKLCQSEPNMSPYVTDLPLIPQ